MALTKKLEEAKKVTCKFIVRHHFLIWAEDRGKRKLIRAKESFNSPSICGFCCVILLIMLEYTVVNKNKQNGLGVLKENIRLCCMCVLSWNGLRIKHLSHHAEMDIEYIDKWRQETRGKTYIYTHLRKHLCHKCDSEHMNTEITSRHTVMQDRPTELCKLQ